MGLRRRRLLACAAALALCPTLAATSAHAPLTVGFLSSSSVQTRPAPGPLEQALARRNLGLARRVQYHYRFAEGSVEALPALAADLVAQAPAVLFCADFAATRAAAEATASIPIVFLAHVDLMEHRFLDSLRSSRRNVTGLTTFRPVLAKLAEVALDAAPRARTMLALLDLSELAARQSKEPLRKLAADRGVRLTIADVRTEEALHAEVARLKTSPHDVVLVPSSTPTWQGRRRLVAAINSLRIPAVYEAAIFLDEGGLVAYGPSYIDVVPRIAEYVERVLSGEHPSSLPILQPTKLELVVNLRSARKQGISLPGLLLQRADRIIE